MVMVMLVVMVIMMTMMVILMVMNLIFAGTHTCSACSALIFSLGGMGASWCVRPVRASQLGKSTCRLENRQCPQRQT